MRPYASLRGRREFALVLRRGRAAASKHVVVFALLPRRANANARSRGPGVCHAKPRAHAAIRVGIVITKKVGSAVERNRLRRRCKAILEQTGFPASPMWYVVQLRPSATQLSFAELRNHLAAGIAGSGRLAGDALRRRETVGP